MVLQRWWAVGGGETTYPTQWLDDAFGPDGIRVTVAVEPAVKALVRERDAWFAPGFSVIPDALRARNLLPKAIQSKVLHDGWAVMVEADSGQKRRLTAPDRDAAMALAQQVRAAVLDRGVPALASYAE